ncbi:UNVERIFIED_CONTAM: hypothetical protein Slati_0478700, partial [Sesamum latifolium]
STPNPRACGIYSSYPGSGPPPPRAVDPTTDPPRRSTSSDTSTEELGAIQQIVAAAFREHVSTTAPPRVTTPSEVEAPKEDAGEEAPVSCANGSRKLRKTELSFFAVRQKDNEHLKEYLQRFNAAALEVPSATQEVKASAFSQGLLDGHFFKSLAKKLVSKFDALLARATKYINMKDAQAAKNQSRREKWKEVKEETPTKKPRIDTRDKKPPFQRVNAVYTPLTIPITQALMAFEGKGLLTRPRSWRDTPQRTKSDKFCRFHSDYGHTTEECRHLKNEIERLIQNGYIQEYVCWEKARGTGPYQKGEGDRAKETRATSLERSPKEGSKQTSARKEKIMTFPEKESYV